VVRRTSRHSPPEEPPQRVAKSVSPRALPHIAKPAISGSVSLVRSAVRRPKPAPAEFPRSRSVPGLNGPPHASNARRLRRAGVRHSGFLPTSSRKEPELPAGIDRSRPLRSGSGTLSRHPTPSSTTAESPDTRISVARVLIPAGSRGFSQGPTNAVTLTFMPRDFLASHEPTGSRTKGNPGAAWPRGSGLFRPAGPQR